MLLESGNHDIEQYPCKPQDRTEHQYAANHKYYRSHLTSSHSGACRGQPPDTSFSDMQDISPLFKARMIMRRPGGVGK
jgi:hypothetical protein